MKKITGDLGNCSQCCCLHCQSYVLEKVTTVSKPVFVGSSRSWNGVYFQSKSSDHSNPLLFILEEAQASIYLTESLPLPAAIRLYSASYITSRQSLITLIEIKQSMRNESHNDNHSVQIEAGHGISHDARSRNFRIDQWSTETTSVPEAPVAALEARNAIRRTWTDIQNEEENAGTIQTRTDPDNNRQAGIEAADGSQPHGTSSFEESFRTENQGPPLSLDYYHQSEWFSGPIWVILTITCDVTILFLFTFESIVLQGKPILSVAAIGLVSSFIYTGTFVVLAQYHEAIEKFLHTYTHLDPILQRMCLHLFTYAAFGGTNTASMFLYAHHVAV